DTVTHTIHTLACLCVQRYATPRALHSFPTRRSSDLLATTPWCRTAPEPGATRGTTPSTTCAISGRSGLCCATDQRATVPGVVSRSEEHTSELQSRGHLVCRLLLEKKKKKQKITQYST